MKKLISKIWAIGLVVTIVSSLLIAAVPASAGTLSWSAETVPTVANNVIGPAGVDIVDFGVAVDGKTIYAVTAAVGNKIYKSVDGGLTWSGLTAPAAVTGAINLIAVSPDDASTAVFLGNIGGLTTNLTGYVTVNGGSTWSTLGTIQSGTAVAATQLWDVDISPLSSGTKYVAAAGTAGANTPGLYYFNLGAAAPTWKNAALTAPATDFTSGLTLPAGVDIVRAVKFSPSFASDQVAVAVSEITNAAAGTAGAVLHALSFNSKAWDAAGGFAAAVTLKSAITGTTGFAIPAASISLAPDYQGFDDATRIAFVGLSVTDTAAEAGGLLRVTGSTLKEIGRANTGIYSVAYNGTDLVAGQILNDNVYRSADPTASTPTVSSARTNKKPGIAACTNTIVAWAGTTVVAGVTGNESAFAISKNKGLSFNDVSLIDTTLTNYTDVAVNADGSKYYLITNDAADTTLWRKDASGWRRVFAIAGTGVSGYIVRLAPENADVVYLADNGIAGTTVYYTKDAGEERWYTRASTNAIGDLAVESADIAYVAVNAAQTVSKTTNGGFTWATAKATELSGGNIYTITSLGTDKLIVGSTTGYVAYSTDGNTTWTKILEQVTTTYTNTQITASGLAAKDYIYAASGGTFEVRRWQVGVSTSWTQLNPALDAATVVLTTPICTGIALVKGALIVTVAETGAGTDSAFVRNTSPTSAVPATTHWVSIDSAAELFTAAPSALKTSTGSVKLWAIDRTGAAMDLFSYNDTVVDKAVVLSSPAATGFQVAMNPVTGRAVDVAFSWAKPSTGVTDYTIKVYTDAAATTQIQSHNFNSTDDTVVVLLGPYQTLTAQVEFTPGQTYYWRARVRLPVTSAWSEIRSFTVEPGVALVPNILSPENGKTGVATMPAFSWSPVAGTTQYKFQLADNAALTTPIVDTLVSGTAYAASSALTEGKTYYWRVKSMTPVEGGWSATANFQIAPRPAPPPPPPPPAPPPVVITQVPAPVITIPAAPPATTITIPPAPPPPAPIAPSYIWAIIVIGAILVIAVIVLIVRTRRTT